MTLYKNQIEAARDVRESFKHISYVILLAQMQSGKTGTFKLVGAEMLREGIIDRVVIFSGNREIDLRKQTEDHRKFGLSYRKYLRSLGMNPDEVDVIEEKIIRNIEVVWGSTLNKFNNKEERILYIWEESHYGQTQEQQVDKFLENIGIQASGVVPDGSYVLSVSATPFSELCDKLHFTQAKEIVYLNPTNNYIGVKHLYENHQIISMEKKDIINHLRKIPVENYGIIRVDKNNELLIQNEAEKLGWNVITYFQKDKYDINKILCKPPSVPTIILIKGKMRMGKQLQKKFVSFCMETTKPTNTDTLLQGLLGRCCGYEGGEDYSANKTIKYYGVNINFSEIHDYLVMVNDYHKKIPHNAMNLKLKRNTTQKYYIAPIIFNMNEHMVGATSYDEKADIAKVAWEKIDNLENTPQNNELKNSNRDEMPGFRSASKNKEITPNKISQLRNAYLKGEPFNPGKAIGCIGHRLSIWCLNEKNREYAVIAYTYTPPENYVEIPKTTGREVFCEKNANFRKIKHLEDLVEKFPDEEDDLSNGHEVKKLEESIEIFPDDEDDTLVTKKYIPHELKESLHNGSIIKYQQQNPKRITSKAYVRYENYKSARSIQEAQDLGATYDDFIHDYLKKGYLQIVQNAMKTFTDKQNSEITFITDGVGATIVEEDKSQCILS
jgi:hypothetical protein